MAVNTTINRVRTRDRRLYTWVAVFFPIIVLIGFARTYYLKGFFGTPALPSLLVHLHGLIMTTWVVLFVTQVSLVATRRTKMHQRLGVAGGILAALVVIVGVLTARAAAARGAAPPGVGALQFLVVPLGDMVVFAILIGTALYFRRKLETHKRLMLIGVVSLLTPAIARIPLSFIETGGPVVFFGLSDLCLLACVVVDTYKNRKLHPVFVWGTLLIIVSQPLRIMLAGTDAWMRFATWFVS